MRRPLLALAGLALLALPACGFMEDDAVIDGPVVSVSTTTTTTESPSTTAPAAAPSTVPATTAAAVSTTPGTCPAIPPRAAPPADRPRYVIRMAIKPADNVVTGDLDLRFTPDLATDELVFRLWPNGPRIGGAGGRLEAGPVLVGSHPAETVTENPTTLVVKIGRRLSAGETVEVSMPWRLTLPRPVKDRVSRTGDAVRLGSFFPVLAWEPGVGWGREPPTSGFAEATTTPVADFSLSIDAPGLDVLASGVPDGSGRWTATAVRDVAVSAGHFTVATGTANAPEPVAVTVGVHEGIGENPQAYVDRIVKALEDFNRRFGAYPWPTYSVSITPDLTGGIEYPMHVLQGPGSGNRTTPHEVAHMWFYGLVGNNQARDPWLDEGLASYAEARVEGTLPSFRSRTIPADAKGRAGEPMTYWEGHQGSYYRGVYVQGAQALAALGDPELVDCALRLFVAANAHRVATNRALVEAIRPVFPDAATVLARYGIRI